MDIVLVCCSWLVKGVARPPMLCVAQNHRLHYSTGSPPLLSDLDFLCEMEHEGP